MIKFGEQSMKNHSLPEKLSSYCESLITEFELISEERKVLLQELGKYIFQNRNNQKEVIIIVICTHNSRRSHMGQLWLRVAAIWFGVDKIHTYSGGTEATAFNHRSVKALRKAGFELVKIEEGENPVYQAHLPLSAKQPSSLFSKKFDHPDNPSSGFAAVLVCNDADQGCPFVPGADARFAITYDDPKSFDDTPLEYQKYEERVRQIGREMFYTVYFAKELMDADKST